MKYTLCITQQCNLRCTYCYIGKKDATMPFFTAGQIIDRLFATAPQGEKISLGFFGGEPLLAYDLLRSIVHMVEEHPSFRKELVEMTVVSNGTVFSEEIAGYLRQHDISLCISCDGPPPVQDCCRLFADGSGSSAVVERNLRSFAELLPSVMVNAVFHPRTLAFLPGSVAYFSDLGIRQLYLNPDLSAQWSESAAERLPGIYGAVAAQYIDNYRAGSPRFISLIDSKIIAMLRGGFDPLERCRMGTGELAFAPSGNIYPCERLIGDDSGEHCIGSIGAGIDPGRMSCRKAPVPGGNSECRTCGISDYCMNWCGCSNYFSTGYYDRVGPFLCASERAAVEAALGAFRTLEKELGPTFVDHLDGRPALGGRR